MKIRMTAVSMTISDENETVEFEHSQKSMIADLIKQAVGFKVK